MTISTLLLQINVNLNIEPSLPFPRSSSIFISNSQCLSIYPHSTQKAEVDGKPFANCSFHYVVLFIYARTTVSEKFFRSD